MANAEMTKQIATGNGFIAALDQSGGSTPKALKQYGVSESAWSDEAGMFDLIHAMRARIIKSPAFDGSKVVGAILFEQTMDRTIDGIPTAAYLWDKRRVVPFLKIDKGLEAEVDGCQLMKPMPGLDALLARAVKAGIYGTKERSVIKQDNAKGIADVLDQQFALGQQVLDAGLVPIIREVLAEAIEAGGSSLRDHRQANGELGYFQHTFRVYDREGHPCTTPGCTGIIGRIVQSGRSSFHCPHCQR